MSDQSDLKINGPLARPLLVVEPRQYSILVSTGAQSDDDRIKVVSNVKYHPAMFKKLRPLSFSGLRIAAAIGEFFCRRGRIGIKAG